MNSEIRNIKFLEVVLTISLIIVIATALFPKGLALWKGAQKESIEYLRVFFSAAINNVHNQWLIKPEQIITIGDDDTAENRREIIVNNRGWPIAVKKAGDTSENTYSLHCENIWSALMGETKNTGGIRNGVPLKVKSLIPDVSHTNKLEEKPFCEYEFYRMEKAYSLIYEPENGSVRLKKQ